MWVKLRCKRALDEGVSYTNQVDRLWGDSEAAASLGILTYVSEPVRIGPEDDGLFGTLCGASNHRVEVSEESRSYLALFAALVSKLVEREGLLRQIQMENEQHQSQALTDPLTGIPNRRALSRELTRALGSVQRLGNAIHVAFIDLDGFKRINDVYGHDAGDRFLIAIANSLNSELRQGDFICRFGGDEFVAFGFAYSPDLEQSRRALQQRLEGLTQGEFPIGDETLHYPGASVGVITADDSETDSEAIVARADAAMYDIKKARKADNTV